MSYLLPLTSDLSPLASEFRHLTTSDLGPLTSDHHHDHCADKYCDAILCFERWTTIDPFVAPAAPHVSSTGAAPLQPALMYYLLMEVS